MEVDSKLGAILLLIVVVLLGLTLFTNVSQIVGDASNTYTKTNITVTMPNRNGELDLTGQELLSTPTVHNATAGTENNYTAGKVINTTNYTIAEGVSSRTGTKRIILTNLEGAWNGSSVNVSYDFGAEGYIDSSGGRSMASLIPLFFALGIAVVLLFPIIRDMAEWS